MNIFDVEVEPPTQREVRALYDKFPLGHVLEVYGTNKPNDGSTVIMERIQTAAILSRL